MKEKSDKIDSDEIFDRQEKKERRKKERKEKVNNT